MNNYLDPTKGANWGTNWRPNDNQKAALEYAREVQYQTRVTKLAEQLGITKQAIYGWNDCKEFVEWWAKHRQKFFETRLDHIHAAIYARATGLSAKGSTQDAKLFLERFDEDYVPASRKELTGGGGGAVKAYVNVNVDEVVGREDQKGEDDDS